MLFQNIRYESLPVYQYSFISSKKPCARINAHTVKHLLELSLQILILPTQNTIGCIVTFKNTSSI